MINITSVKYGQREKNKASVVMFLEYIRMSEGDTQKNTALYSLDLLLLTQLLSEVICEKSHTVKENLQKELTTVNERHEANTKTLQTRKAAADLINIYY